MNKATTGLLERLAQATEASLLAIWLSEARAALYSESEYNDEYEMYCRTASFDLDEDETTIGRGKENIVILASKSVSRQHASILVKDKAVELTVVGKNTKIKVSCAAEKTAAPGTYQLAADDEFTIGPYRWRVVTT